MDDDTAPGTSPDRPAEGAWKGEERRKHLRYPCAGEAEVRVRGSEVSLQGQLSDVSLGGCYVDMMNPLPAEIDIDLNFSLGEIQISVQGRVRTSRQGFGMGIEFSQIKTEERTKLEELVSLLAGALPL